MINTIYFDFYDVIRSSSTLEYDYKVIGLIKSLSSNYTLGLISNSSGPRVRAALAELGLEPYFLTVLLSGEIGMAKPSREIYELALRETNSNIDQTLIVDDKAEYMTGAVELGMTTIQFMDYNQLVDRLKKLNIRF